MKSGALRIALFFQALVFFVCLSGCYEEPIFRRPNTDLDPRISGTWSAENVLQRGDSETLKIEVIQGSYFKARYESRGPTGKTWVAVAHGFARNVEIEHNDFDLLVFQIALAYPMDFDDDGADEEFDALRKKWIYLRYSLQDEDTLVVDMFNDDPFDPRPVAELIRQGEFRTYAVYNRR
jgi:hypothetical protein